MDEQSEENQKFIFGDTSLNDENSVSETVQTNISNFLVHKDKFSYLKIVSFAVLSYLYISIPVQGNFLFRHKILKHFVFVISFFFVLFTMQVSLDFYFIMLMPIFIIGLDLLLIHKRGRGINFMFYEVWGILICCCWIVNLMLIMMDILLFLSNIFGVSILIFTCVFIAVGNNIAGNHIQIIYFI